MGKRTHKVLFKIGDTINWSGNFFKEFKAGWNKEKAIKYLNENSDNIDMDKIRTTEFLSGTNKIVDIIYELNMYFYLLDNGRQLNSEHSGLSLAFRTPKFYQTALAEIKGNVLDVVYPEFRGENQLTLTERMGSEEAKCPECSNNEWWLLPGDSVAVREGGKPYIECLNCGHVTHL